MDGNRSKILSACPLDLNAAVAFLRDAGLSKITCIKAPHDRFGLTLEAAKAAVHSSAAWADRRDADEFFHGALEALVTGVPRAS